MRLSFFSSSPFPSSNVLGFTLLLLSACGHSNEEMMAKQQEIENLNADLNASKTQLLWFQTHFGDSRNEAVALKSQLELASSTMTKSRETQEQLERALREAKLRAEQLAGIETRFRELKTKLEKLSKLGLQVSVRHNRMVIQLSGDILFDSGKDLLKPRGKEVLFQVAQAIRSDSDLNARHFQVAGHTDNARYTAGPFQDNWGLSLARARSVLLYLIAPSTEARSTKEGGGNLSPALWSAAGYGDSDPVAGTQATQTREEMAKNRRVELVVQPNVEEMLNLEKLSDR